MATILIGYDLNRAGQDYAGLIDKIKTLGAWWHHLDSTWIVKSSLSAEGVRNALLPYIDTSDELLVADMTGTSAAWYGFNASASQWLKANW